MFRPLKDITIGLQRLVQEAIVQSELPQPREVTIEETRSKKHGDLFTSVAFKIAKTYKDELGMGAQEIARLLAMRLSGRAPTIISRVEPVGGYINFFLNRGEFAKYVLSGILSCGPKYGALERCPYSGKIIIEHTSANPIHPLHIGLSLIHI